MQKKMFVFHVLENWKLVTSEIQKKKHETMNNRNTGIHILSFNN